MTPQHVLLIVQAECVKLMSRRSAQMGLLLSALLGIGMPLLLIALTSSGTMVNGATLADSLEPSGPRAALWALKLRNLWIMQTFVVLLVGQSVAGELSARTLREDLLRPVHRSAVLGSKLAAIMLFVALTLVIQYLFSTALGTLVLGADGPWKEMTLGYIASGLGDLSFAAVVFAVATVLRSMSGTLVGMVLFIVFEKMLSWFLFIAGSVLQSMPPEWNQLPELAWVALVVYFFGGWLVADRVFARIEVP